MKYRFFKIFQITIALLISTPLFANGGNGLQSSDIAGAKVILTNDKDFTLQKENLSFCFEDEFVIVECEYELKNTSTSYKSINFSFNIPSVSVSSEFPDVLEYYKIFSNNEPIFFQPKIEYGYEDPWGIDYTIWEISELNFIPNETKQLRILYKIRSSEKRLNYDGSVMPDNYTNNVFKYNLFPAATFGNGKIGEFNLKIDKTDMLQKEGKIVKISGIDIKNDNSKDVQIYSFKNFDLNKNLEILIEYDLKGFYVARSIKKRSSWPVTNHRRFVENVSSTSMLREKNTIYSADKLFDRDYTSAWCEGKADFGKNERIHFQLGQGDKFYSQWESAPLQTYLYLVNGFRKTEKTYTENNRVKKIRLYADGKFLCDVTFPDRPYKAINDMNLAYEAELLPLSEYIYEKNNDSSKAFSMNPFETLDIEILEVYPGTKYNDTCISELVIFTLEFPLR